MSANNFYTSSPTVVLPPAQPDQYFANRGCGTNGDLTSNGYFGAASSGSVDSITPSAGALAGRKRTRGDDHSPEEDGDEGEAAADGAFNPTSSSAMDTSPTYGPGMTVINPNDPGYPAGVREMDQIDTVAPTQRPSITSRKSQRMNTSSAADDHLAQLLLPPQIREATTEPLIDEATRALGISWTRMDSSEALLINQAAYSKWIQHHYSSLRDVVVWFENSALPGYLVSANNVYSGQQEFYIFSHDLTEARLVTTDPTQLISRLKMLPALHLAAPGGHIRAESNASAASGTDMQADQAANPGASESPIEDFPPPTGICAAHSMEMD